MTKTALITGASSGIGKELAIIHAKQKGDLVLVARSEDKLQDLQKELESKYSIQVVVLAKDLTTPNAAQDIYDAVQSKNIQVEYLINNAGFGGLGKFAERELEKETQMIQLNILALTQLTHLFVQDMIKRNSGRIMNISSTASLMPGPLQAVYFATKAYVTSFSNALYEELSDTNIRVTNIMPGATKTKFGEVSGMDKTPLFDKTASAEVVAKESYRAMIKGKMNLITGVTWSNRILFKLLPFLPKKMVLKQVRDMQKTK